MLAGMDINLPIIQMALSFANKIFQSALLDSIYLEMPARTLSKIVPTLSASMPPVKPARSGIGFRITSAFIGLRLTSAAPSDSSPSTEFVNSSIATAYSITKIISVRFAPKDLSCRVLAASKSNVDQDSTVFMETAQI